MRCEHCGKENRAEAKFCLNCGMRIQSLREQKLEPEEIEEPAVEEVVEETPVEEAPKKKKGKKWLIIAIAAVLLAAVGVGVWYFFLRPKQNESVYPAGIFYVFDTKDGEAVVYGGKVVLESDGEIHVTNNVDGKAAACQTEDGLYLVTADSAVKITDKQVEYSKVSLEGAAVVYEAEETLYLYNAEEKKTSEIAKGAETYVLSPTGKYVVYRTEDGLYRWNGETVKLDDKKNACYFSVSDDGLVYVLVEGALYCFDQNGERTMIQDGWEGSAPLYNKDQTQILFIASDGETSNLYFSENGEPAVKLLSDAVTTFGCKMTYGIAYQGTYGSSMDFVCNMKDFRGQVLQAYVRNEEGEAALIYIDRELNAEIVLGYSEYSFSMFYECAYDNSYVYANYRSDDRKLYRIDVKTGEKERLKKNVSWFASAGDGVVYYLDEDGTLYRWNDDNSERIAKNIGRAQFVGTDDGGVLYVDGERTLWYAAKNGEPEKVDQKVRELWRDGSGFYYAKGDSVRFSADGTDFAKIEGVIKAG